MCLVKPFPNRATTKQCYLITNKNIKTNAEIKFR